MEKEYLVQAMWESPEGPVERNISAVFPAEEIERLRHGLSLDGVPLKPAKVSWQNEEQLRFVLREGRKRQIRRMCEQVGLRVVGLKRVRMGRVVLGDLPPGQWRFLGAFEKFWTGFIPLPPAGEGKRFSRLSRRSSPAGPGTAPR